MITDLNVLDTLASDIGNAYINAPFRENIYFTAGTGFFNQKGDSVVVVCALYGLKYGGAAWRSYCDGTMRGIFFTLGGQS